MSQDSLAWKVSGPFRRRKAFPGNQIMEHNHQSREMFI